MANSWQQPVDAEPGGGQWHKFEDPSTGWFASKVAGWTADQFTPGGLEVDFSLVAPKGTRATRVVIYQATALSDVYYRKSGDTNVSNTPGAASEYSHRILAVNDANMIIAVIWLSADYKAQLTVSNVNTDLYIAFPIEYML